MRKLPPLATIKHALGLVLRFWALGTRIGLPWIIAITVMNAFAIFSAPEQPPARSVDDMVGAINAFDYVILGVTVIAYSSIAVNWHRYILLDVVPAAGQTLRLDRPVWTYAWNTVLIVLMVTIPLAVAFTIVLAAAPALAILMVVPAIMAAVVVTIFSLRLPAIALGEAPLPFAATLALTKGNFFNLAGVLLLNVAVFFILIVVLSIVMSIISAALPSLSLPLALVIGMPVNLFYTLFNITLLTSLYGFFVQNRDF